MQFIHLSVRLLSIDIMNGDRAPPGSPPYSSPFAISFALFINSIDLILNTFINNTSRVE